MDIYCVFQRKLCVAYRPSPQIHNIHAYSPRDINTVLSTFISSLWGNNFSHAYDGPRNENPGEPFRTYRRSTSCSYRANIVPFRVTVPIVYFRNVKCQTQTSRVRRRKSRIKSFHDQFQSETIKMHFTMVRTRSISDEKRLNVFIAYMSWTSYFFLRCLRYD